MYIHPYKESTFSDGGMTKTPGNLTMLVMRSNGMGRSLLVL